MTSLPSGWKNMTAVRVVVRRFRSPDADLDRYVPDDPEDVGLLVQMMVGPVP
jgi:hypothetical protein